MFGYVRIRRGELRVKEYEYYRASYCGLCRSMGKCTGQCSRMLLSFDFAYLANVRMQLAGTVPTFRARRCMVHPLRRRVMMERNEQLDFCAVASTVLAYEKCRDDVADEKGFARLKARLSCFLLHGAYRRAKKRAPLLAQCVRAHLLRLSEEEKKQSPSADAAASIFGDLLADVSAYGLEGPMERLAHKIGWETGRFVYMLDALDDLEQDLKKGRFNPFLRLFGGIPDEEQKKGVRDAILNCLGDLEAAIDLLPGSEDPTRREILNNILYLGMPDALARALSGKACNKEDSDGKQPL